MQIGRRALLLSPGARVHGGLLGLSKSGVQDGVIGRVELADGAQRVLRNVSDLVWHCEAGGRSQDIPPAGLAPLHAGGVLHFTPTISGRILQ